MMISSISRIWRLSLSKVLIGLRLRARIHKDKCVRVCKCLRMYFIFKKRVLNQSTSMLSTTLASCRPSMLPLASGRLAVGIGGKQNTFTEMEPAPYIFMFSLALVPARVLGDGRCPNVLSILGITMLGTYFRGLCV